MQINYYNLILYIFSLIFSTFILWIIFVRNKIFSNNDFWDYVFLFFLTSTIGQIFFSIQGFLIFGLLGMGIFFKIKSYKLAIMIDFYSLFSSLVISAFLLDFKYLYGAIGMLISILIILLININIEGYGISILYLFFSVIYFFNRSLWIFGKNNYIFNLDFDAIVISISIIFFLLNILFKSEKLNNYKDILKRKV